MTIPIRHPDDPPNPGDIKKSEIRDENIYSGVVVKVEVHASLPFKGTSAWDFGMHMFSLCGTPLPYGSRNHRAATEPVEHLTCDMCKILASVMQANKVRVKTRSVTAFRRLLRKVLDGI